MGQTGSPAELAPEITRWGRFASPEMEVLYRDRHLRHDTRQISIVLAVVIAAAILFIPSDYANLGSTWHFRILLGARVSMAAISAILLLVLRRGLPTATRDPLLFALVLLGSGAVFSVGASPPSQYFPPYPPPEGP